MFFTMVPNHWHYVADFNFHFFKAQGCEANEADCQGYFPLLHILGTIFSFSKFAFSRYLMFLLVFITPLILFYITKKWIVTWFYFATTQYVYLIEGGGAYPQALAGIFLLLLLSTKNNYLRAIILLVSIISHSQAFILIGISWLVILFFENFSFKNVFPACSALFGRTVDPPLGEKVLIDVGPKGFFLWKDILNFFVRIFPFPFLIAAFWQLHKQKNYAFIVLTVIFFGLGIFVSPRIFYNVPLILLPALTVFYHTLKGKWKYGFLVLTVLSFVVQMGTWILFKVNCVAP